MLMGPKESEVVARHIQIARDTIEQIYNMDKVSRGFGPCPICHKGMLKYRVSDNGTKIHAVCTTEGCVAWVE